jgi:hypothetical protein
VRYLRHVAHRQLHRAEVHAQGAEEDGGSDAGGNNVIEWWDYYVWGYEAPDGGSGYASTLPVEPQRDYGAELRAVVEEVTGKPVDAPIKPRIGFL